MQDFAEAERVIERGARKIGALSDDPEVQRLAENMRNSVGVVGAPMHRLASKGYGYGASTKLRGRTLAGHARKSADPEPTDKTS